ncbi:MAG: hypothetical protein EXR07_20960 [Acetobacteraceae bacterium]|nr:hypothetical protein [Acetobacteraceae bacterium]
MGILDIFRRRLRIREPRELADFIDRNAAFITQKGIYEYSRARAGHYSKVLFREPTFRAACDDARWRAFPLGLAMVGELVEGVLCPSRSEDRLAQVEAIRALVLTVFDRYPIPTPLDETVWSELRGELDQHMRRIGLHPPKTARDVPVALAATYFSVMPIHPKLRGRDAPTLLNYLRVTMCNIHDTLTRSVDAGAVVASLRAGPLIQSASIL